MHDFMSQIHGGVKFYSVNDSTVAAIESFLSSPSVISEHMSKTKGFKVSYSLPPAVVTSVGIDFSDVPGEYLNVEESLSIIVALLKGLDVREIDVNVVKVGNRYDDIVKFAYKYGRIMKSPATIVFQAFN